MAILIRRRWVTHSVGDGMGGPSSEDTSLLDPLLFLGYFGGLLSTVADLPDASFSEQGEPVPTCLWFSQI